MTIFCGLIAGRHILPDVITDNVFSTDIPQIHITDSAYMDRICNEFLDRHPEADTIAVYISGFTPALLALIKACANRNLHLTAYNFDREGRTFWNQEVL